MLRLLWIFVICILLSFPVNICSAEPGNIIERVNYILNNTTPVNAYIPAGTKIPVELLDTVTSETSFAGQAMGFRTLEDVVVDNVVVIERGTIGYANVLGVRSVYEYGRWGGVEFSPVIIKTVNNIPVKLGNKMNSYGVPYKVAVPLQKVPKWLRDKNGSRAISKGTKIIAEVVQNVDLGVSPEYLPIAINTEVVRKNSIHGYSRFPWAGTWTNGTVRVVMTQSNDYQVVGKTDTGDSWLHGQVNGNELEAQVEGK